MGSIKDDQFHITTQTYIETALFGFQVLFTIPEPFTIYKKYLDIEFEIINFTTVLLILKFYKLMLLPRYINVSTRLNFIIKVYYTKVAYFLQQLA